MYLYVTGTLCIDLSCYYIINLIHLDKRHQRNTKNMSIRSAKHAGSWYERDGNALGRELEEWLKSASAKSGSGNPAARAIIGPHAGYKYCGACGGHAYARIDPTNVRRVFILGPSHHVRLNGCAVSGCVKVIKNTHAKKVYIMYSNIENVGTSVLIESIFIYPVVCYSYLRFEY